MSNRLQRRNQQREQQELINQLIDEHPLRCLFSTNTLIQLRQQEFDVSVDQLTNQSRQQYIGGTIYELTQQQIDNFINNPPDYQQITQRRINQQLNDYYHNQRQQLIQQHYYNNQIQPFIRRQQVRNNIQPIQIVQQDQQPIKKRKLSIKETKTIESNDDCPICLENLLSEDILCYCEHNCGRWFHFDCVEDWINVKKTCPLCRTQWN
jgi:hypothetical protein